MEIGKIIGANIKDYRLKLGYVQENIANYLGVDTSTISKYENAEREISIVHLNKLTNLFGTTLETFVEPNAVNSKANLAFAFRSDGINEKDMESIASFQKIVKNYIKMKQLINEQE